MQIETAQYALGAGMALLLLVASVTDWQRREIDDWLNFAIALSAPLFWLATGLSPWPDMAIQVGLGVFVFALGAGLFALGQMGGGDVKLLGALALWFTPIEMMRLLIAMSLFGGALTVAMLIRQKWHKLEGRPEIPYGIAITFAGLWAIYERYLNHFSPLLMS